MKDEDLTHTKYDDYNREQLLAAVKEAGCYVKDDKKSVMARKLAEHDRNLQDAQRRAVQERKEKEDKRQQEIKEATKAKNERRKARVKRNEDKGRRRERGDDVSSNSDDTIDVDEEDRLDAQRLTVTGGEALSDETWEDTCSETTVCSKNRPINPDCKLRLFEWSYTTIPPSSPLLEPWNEQFPSQITYTPLKLLTTHTHEKVTLPGSKYPAGVEPDFAPVLDPLTRSAVRRGHLIGLLARATIEPARVWASRTIVQGWNGCMYFFLPRLNGVGKPRLDTVYRKRDLEISGLLRPTAGTTDPKTDWKRRRAQRLACKRKAAAEVYEVCKWTPLAMSYVPAYLDWDPRFGSASLSCGDKSIDKLYYVRFPGCDLPHYYFWATESEWGDPTVPDLAWSPKVLEQQSTVETAAKLHALQALRVRKRAPLPVVRLDSPLGSEFDTTASAVEHDLLTHGLAAMLTKYKTFANSIGRKQAWDVFTRDLPGLYPSGTMPEAPPVEPANGMCVVEKVAALLSGRAILHFTGKESWTRDDDSAWDKATRADSKVLIESELVVMEELENLPQSVGNVEDDREVGALYRRGSVDDLIPRYRQELHIYTWLEHTSSAYSPLMEPLSPSTIRIETEYEPPSSPSPMSGGGTCPTCPFCSHSWYQLKEWQKAEHMLSHSQSTLANANTAASHINAMGKCAKRRHSRLTMSTLRSYHDRGNGSKMLKVGSGAFLAERWAKMGKEDSPFTKEVRRVRTGRPSALERKASGISDCMFVKRALAVSPSHSNFADDEAGTAKETERVQLPSTRGRKERMVKKSRTRR